MAETDSTLAARYADIRSRIDAAARVPTTLVAVGKTRPAADLRALHALGQRAFGENYVQEALTKMDVLAGCEIEWHLIGPLQSNKCREVARHFDWLQTLDRAKLVPMLARERPAGRAPLNVLVQVNLDDEDSKSGAAPEALDALADQVANTPRLRLRGLMAIPKPWPDAAQRRTGFRALRALYEALRARHPGIDTLSMGMSEDFELALAEGATMVRVGSALFGARG